MSALGGGDPKTDAMIERRRALDKERLTRIKDPKTRTMGIDTDALAAQLADKQAAKASEKLRDLAYDNERLLLDQQLAYLEQERLRAERAKAVGVADYITTYQGKEKSREYDLSDPLALKKDEPARTGDDDPKVSVSGLQRFLGEDLSYAHRVKMQQQEQSSWNAQQIATKASMKGGAGDLDKTYAARAMERLRSRPPFRPASCPSAPSAYSTRVEGWRRLAHTRAPFRLMRRSASGCCASCLSMRARRSLDPAT